MHDLVSALIDLLGRSADCRWSHDSLSSVCEFRSGPARFKMRSARTRAVYSASTPAGARRPRVSLQRNRQHAEERVHLHELAGRAVPVGRIQGEQEVVPCRQPVHDLAE